MTDDSIPDTKPEAAKPRGRRRSLIVGGALAGAILLAVGAAAGAGASHMFAKQEAQTLLPPVAVNAMPEDSLVAVKGRVAEIYGNKFIIDDGSARALVDTGPEGDDAELVKAGETVTVQGRHGDDRLIRGSLLIHEGGKTEILGPAGGPPRHGPGWKHR